MSVLGKYRKEEDRKDVEQPKVSASKETSQKQYTSAIPNSDRKSPIMSFSVTTDLRSCLQAVRNQKAINLSMWVERRLREALSEEFPEIARNHLT